VRLSRHPQILVHHPHSYLLSQTNAFLLGVAPCYRYVKAYPQRQHTPVATVIITQGATSAQLPAQANKDQLPLAYVNFSTTLKQHIALTTQSHPQNFLCGHLRNHLQVEPAAIKDTHLFNRKIKPPKSLIPISFRFSLHRNSEAARAKFPKISKTCDFTIAELFSTKIKKMPTGKR